MSFIPFNRIGEFTRDDLLTLDDGNTYAASGLAQVASANKIIDMGANYADVPYFDVVIKVTSADGADADETYTVAVQQSTASNMSAVVRQDIQTLTRGATVEKFLYFRVVPFARYLAIYFTLGGTTPSLVIEEAQIIEARNN